MKFSLGIQFFLNKAWKTKKDKVFLTEWIQMNRPVLEEKKKPKNHSKKKQYRSKWEKKKITKFIKM